MKLSLIPSIGLLVALAGCPADDSGGDDDGANDGSTTNSTTPTTTEAQTSGPEDTGTTAADSGSATDTGTPGTDSGGTDSGGSESGTGSESGGKALCADATPIVGLAAGLSFDDLENFPEPPPVGGTGGSTIGSATDGGPPPPPSDELRLVLGNYDLSCEDPYGSYECKMIDKWRLWIDIPLMSQVEGVHDLADMDIFFTEIGAGMPPECGGAGTTGAGDGGGGGGWEGQLIIESIDANGITGCIEGAQFSFDANGSFDSTACMPM